MKKLLLIPLVIMGINYGKSQVVEIPTGNASTSTTTLSSVLRKPYGTYWGYERSAFIYKASEIGVSGTLSKISFYLDASSSPSAAPVKIYVKETADSAFASGTLVSSEESGATLVYNNTIPASAFTTTPGYVEVTLSNTFVYSGSSNLEIIVETNAGGTGSEGNAAKTFRFNSTGTVGRFQYWQADNTPPTSTGTVGTNRPNVKLEFLPNNPCTDPPTAGIVQASDTALCMGSSFSLTLSGTSLGSGQTYTWQISPDNNNWSNISGANTMSYSGVFNGPAYFRCLVTCGTTVSTPSVFINQKNIMSCYCTSTATSSLDDDIGNVTFNTINNGNATPSLNNPSSTNTYTDYTAISTTVFKGSSYPISVSQINSGNFYTCYVTVFIDFNRNGVFEVNEKFDLGSTSSGNMTVNGVISIPINAVTGITRMRVILTETSNVSACGTYSYGETEDYSVDIQDPSACTDPPTAGTTIASANTVCPSATVNFYLQGYVYGTGQTLNWQTSTDSIQWNDITGATNSVYSASFNTTTYVRCKVTCTTTEYSIPVKVTVQPFYSCYCIPSHGSCNNVLTNISIVGTTLNTDTTCNGNNGYTQVAPSVNTTATLIKGNSYGLSVTTNTAQIISAWIDYNQNGNFETNEWFQVTTSSTANTPAIKNFTVPISALSGTTGMRIRTRATGNTNDSTSACSTFGSGETVDLSITLVDPGPCTDPPTAGTTVANKTSICATENVNLSLQGNTFGTGQTYTWQSSTDSSQWNNITGANQAFYTVSNLSTTTWFRCKLTCGSGTSYSVPVKITVKPFNLCYCNTGLQSNNCNNSTGILGVEILFESLVNYNQCTSGGPAYTAFPPNVATENFGIGQTYTIRVTANSVFNLGMWIDYNQNGQYEATEYTSIATNQPAGTPADKTFTIPNSAQLGQTGMRIRARSASFTASDACTSFASGETQDYIVTIDNSVGLTKNNLKPTISLMPNPAKDQVNLIARGLKGKWATIQVYNVNGALLLQTSLAIQNGELKTSLNTINLTAGLYQIQVISENQLFNQKLIIQ